VPYLSRRYYLNFSNNFNSVDVFFNTSWRERELTFDNEIQSFADISARVGYNFTRNTKLAINGGYRSQDGRGLSLNLTNLRMELTHRIRQLFLCAGFEIYRRDFSGEIINYQGGFLKVERNF
jgi:hypothetical protein